MGYSPGKQQLFHPNECMHKRGVTCHMTIFHIMNTSDADGRRFNLAKRDCGRAAVWTTLPQSSPRHSNKKKGKWCTWQPQMASNDTDRNISSEENGSESRSHEDDAYSSMTGQKLRCCAATTAPANLHVPSPAARAAFLFHLDSTSGSRLR